MSIGKIALTGLCLAFAGLGELSACGAIPDSRYQYAADGEYHDLLLLPWVSSKAGSPVVEFRYPKCFQKQEVNERYEDVMLFNGVIKLVAGNVVAGFMLMMNDGTKELQSELNRVFKASKAEMKSPQFLASVKSLAGRKDIVEYGIKKVNGRNSFWCTVTMERRIGNQVIYRGLQRLYLIPLKGAKRFVTAGFVVGVLGIDEFPYSDFKAFEPVGEKYIESVFIKENRWKFW